MTISRQMAGVILERLRAGERVVLSTVGRVWGSTPCGPGARMLTWVDGTTAGTVGGGPSESLVARAALESLGDGEPRLIHADMNEEVGERNEGVCGGWADFVVRPWGRELLPVIEAVAAVLAAPAAACHIFLRTCLEPGPYLGAMVASEAQTGSSGSPGGLLAWAGLPEKEARRIARLDPAGEGVLVEEVRRPEVLVICGGGHVGLAVAEAATRLGFEITVIDDRREYASRRRFPQAGKILVGPFVETLAGLALGPETAVVVVTRGHAQDMECVEHLLGRETGYLGMIGSRRRVAGVLSLLREKGHSQEVLAGLHAPIGLDIGARTPDEIAISILAEILMIRRGGNGRPLSLTVSRSPATTDPLAAGTGPGPAVHGR